MATITAHDEVLHSAPAHGRLGAFARLALFVALPLAGFGAANLVADATRTLPVFFSPAGLPGWAGAGVHIFLLATIGLALGLTYAKGAEGRRVLPWGIALVAGMIVFPFFAPQLDSLTLALVMTLVLMLGLATGLRIARVSSAASWLMLPTLIWVGFGAALGLAVAAAWSPPFALITAQSPAPAAAS